MAPTSHKLPAILLAAGLSSRMKAFKPLLTLAGKPLLLHAHHALQNSHAIDPIITVAGHRANDLRAILQTAAPAHPFVLNPSYAQGEMLSSLLTGLNALPTHASGFVLAFADQPFAKPSTIYALVQRFFEQSFPLVLPTFLGKRGHPVVLSRSLENEIRELPPGDTLKTVVYRHLDHAALLPVDDPGVVEDLDTPEDFVRAQAKMDISPQKSLSHGGAHA